MTIAYILDLFPILSETFIVREILELKKKQLRVPIFAFRNTADHIYSEVIHDDTRKIIKDVNFLSSLTEGTRVKRWALIVFYNFYFILKNPVRYTQTFWYSVRHGKEMFTRFVFSVLYAKELTNSNIDHMHVHFALEACTYTMIISKLTGIPYSLTVHAHDIFIPKLADVLEDKINSAKFTVCISEFNKHYIVNKFPSINQDEIKIIHCGLDLSKFTPQVKAANEKFMILAIGRLVEHKGFKYLVKACHLLYKKGGLDFVCNIIGEGHERKDLEELISRYHMSKVMKLSGSMEQEDVMIALKSCDLFVLPCVVEENGMMDGIPVSLMEAMALKIPVISTTVSGVPELIRDGSGILTEPENAEDLSRAIEMIMRLPDKEKMLSKGRAIIEDSFNIEKEAEKLIALYTA